MSRITIQLARDVANAMLKERTIKHRKFEVETGEIIHKHVVSLLPKEVVKLFKSKYKDYIRTTHYVRALGQGLNFDHINTPDYPCTSTSDCKFPQELALEISKRLEIAKNEDKEIRDLIRQIEATLIDLRTFKKVKEFFPEATPFLPKENKAMFLPVNLNSLRAKLK